MTGSRAACLILALIAIPGLAVPNAAVGAACQYAEFPPEPPAGGAVLWSSSSDPTVPNTLVLGLGEQSDVTHCPAPIQTPWVILVAPGGALVFHGHDTEMGTTSLVSPWGAVNVPTPGAAPIDVNPRTWGRWQYWGTTMGVAVVDPLTLLSSYASCRNCVMPHPSNAPTPCVLPGLPDESVVGFVGQVTGATLVNVEFSGSGYSYDFSNSDLSFSKFRGSLERATFNNVTVTSTSFLAAQFEPSAIVDLRGATFSSLKFGALFLPPPLTPASVGAGLAPNFDGALLGRSFPSAGEGFKCTSFANSNLILAGFSSLTWEGDCTGSPLFPNSQIALATLRALLDANAAKSVDISGTTVVTSIKDRAALAGSDLGGMNLSSVEFLGIGPDFTATRFDGANLSGTNFGLARLAGTSFSNVSADRASFLYADLSGDGSNTGANFSGPHTSLQHANFVNANVSGAKFVGANISGAQFIGALGVDTDFSGVTGFSAVTGNSANFSRAHIYGNGNAFHDATDLKGIDFSDAVLAGDASVGGGFDFTGAPLQNANFDGAVCVACNLTKARLDSASFVGAYLPGVTLSGATLDDASFDRAWLYCGSLTNAKCDSVPGATPRWNWPLTLGSGEALSLVPFGSTDVTLQLFQGVSTCPNGEPGKGPCGLLVDEAERPEVPIPASCRAAGRGTCPTPTTTLIDTSTNSPDPPKGNPLAVVAATPPTWNTKVFTDGYYLALDDGSIWLIGDESARIVAGTPGAKCPDGTAPCGDGGLATAALLNTPSGLAVGLDGSLFIADSGLFRVRVIDPAGIITTVAGTGQQCPVPCQENDFLPATSKRLHAAIGVAVDSHGNLYIADGDRGVVCVEVGFMFGCLGNPSVSVTVTNGKLYAASHSPDSIIEMDLVPTLSAPRTVVGTGTSGYNGSTDRFRSPLPGTQVQVNKPGGLSVDLEGKVLFADTGNNLIRAYLPSRGFVIDNLAGQIVNNTPQRGNNGDGHPATDTQLDQPLGVAATRSAVLVIADTANQRVLQVGPVGPASSEVAVSCRTGTTWSCRRLPAPPASVAAESAGAVTISQEGSMFATGRSFLLAGSRLRLHIIEHQPLVPGRYDLVITQGGRPRQQTIWIDQAPDVTERGRP